MRPLPVPLRSARSRNVRSSPPNDACWMSFAVSPRPRPLSGSLLVIESSFTVGFGSHMSVTVIVAVIGTSLWSGGQSDVGDSLTLSVGGVVSTIVTDCVAALLFCDSSVAVHVTLVVPRPNSAGASFVSTGEASHTSVAAAVPRATGVPFGPVHSAVTAAGALIVGAVVSTTLTLVVSSSYCPNRSMTFNTYDVALLDEGVLTGCSSCTLS